MDEVLCLAAGKVDEKLAPVREAAGRLRAMLDAWEAAERAEAERGVTERLFAALGTELPVADPAACAEVRAELAEAAAAVLEMVGSKAAQASAPEPAPEPPRPADPPPKPEPTTEHWARAEKLLLEIEDFEKTAGSQHPLRTGPLLQAIVAELRLLMDELSVTSDLYDRLGKRLGTLNTVRRTCKVDQFIKGLAFGAPGDWARISKTCRRKVEEFDRDADKPVAPSKPHPQATAKAAPPVTPSAPSEPASAPAPESIADLEHLRVLERPILLGGGRPLPPGMLESIAARLGVPLEHHPIDHDNPRAAQTLLARIKSGKVSAIILIEGFMRHSTFKPLVDACSVGGVPYAYSGKGGILGIESALGVLEEKMSKRERKAR
jgi:hypothetical protein